VVRRVCVRWTAPSRSEEDTFSVGAQEESAWDATREQRAPHRVARHTHLPRYPLHAPARLLQRAHLPDYLLLDHRHLLCRARCHYLRCPPYLHDLLGLEPSKDGGQL
jgi:hypothetical protein